MIIANDAKLYILNLDFDLILKINLGIRVMVLQLPPSPNLLFGIKLGVMIGAIGTGTITTTTTTTVPEILYSLPIVRLIRKVYQQFLFLYI